MKKTMCVAAVAALGAIALEAKVELGVPFADHAVLQRGREVPVWGRADPGAKVKVSFAGMTREATAGVDGAWCVKLGAMDASCEGRTLTAEAGPGISSTTSKARSFFWSTFNGLGISTGSTCCGCAGGATTTSSLTVSVLTVVFFLPFLIIFF